MQSVAEPATTATRRPTAAEFYAANRGGGLYSEAISQRIGAVVAVIADRLGIAPTILTLINLVLGLAASALVVVFAPRMAAGEVPAWLIGLIAFVAWQLAYAIDCADGQLARVTKQSSDAGARVDVLADVAVQIALVVALASTAMAYQPDTPVWLVTLFAGTWMVNLVTSVMHSSGKGQSMVTSSSLPVRIVKLVRDYGAVVAGCGLVLAFLPQLMVWLVGAVTVVNGLFLLASVAFAARSALR